MAVSPETQVLFARQILAPAIKEMKRVTAKRMKVKMTEEELLGAATFACCQLALETYGVQAFDQVRALVDQLETMVIEQHRRG